MKGGEKTVKGVNITESIKTYVESQKRDDVSRIYADSPEHNDYNGYSSQKLNNLSATHTDGPAYNDHSGDNDHTNWNNS